MKKYPSIGQYRNLVRSVRLKHDFKCKDEEGNPVYRNTSPYPTLKFRGTVKIHGTNASIVKYSDGRIEYQSRERVLTLESDNAGFMAQMSQTDLSVIFSQIPYTEYAAIYGEWCGGNIQKGVAVSGLPKMFVIFGLYVDGQWAELPETLHCNQKSIYNILQFKTYEIDIDFNSPESVQNKLIEMTEQVEKKCPVGEYFGKDGVGEGIVFTCIYNQELTFKSKGEKHSVTKVKKLNTVDAEMLGNINEFIRYAVTDNRMLQGLSYFRDNNISHEMENIGHFLSWVVKDVIKEESDTIISNGLNERAVKNEIVKAAKKWFIEKMPM